MPMSRLRPRRPAVLVYEQGKLESLHLDSLREALRANAISFPNPVPTFERHHRADIQWRLVQLYFVLGWSCQEIARRYGFASQRVSQILTIWKRRAIETGYIQSIPPFRVLPDLFDAPAAQVAPNLAFQYPATPSFPPPPPANTPDVSLTH
jgi:hypothetical protein